MLSVEDNPEVYAGVLVVNRSFCENRLRKPESLRKRRLSPVSLSVTEGEATFNFCVTEIKSGKLLKVVFFLFN